MPAEHIIYIPMVFLLGFVLGGWLVTRLACRQLPATRETAAEASAEGATRTATSIWPVLSAFAVFASAFISTHIFPLFGGAKAIANATAGLRLLDQQPAFSSAEVYARLTEFGVAGRTLYQQFTYSTDVLFPLTFLVFLLLMARYVSARSALGTGLRRSVLALPLLWFATDMLENAMLFSLLAGFPSRNDLIASGLGLVTVGKFVLLLLSISAPLLCSLLLRKSRERNQAG
jgi:hypothetical protein